MITVIEFRIYHKTVRQSPKIQMKELQCDMRPIYTDFLHSTINYSKNCLNQLRVCVTRDAFYQMGSQPDLWPIAWFAVQALCTIVFTWPIKQKADSINWLNQCKHLIEFPLFVNHFARKTTESAEFLVEKGFFKKKKKINQWLSCCEFVVCLGQCMTLFLSRFWWELLEHFVDNCKIQIKIKIERRESSQMSNKTVYNQTFVTPFTLELWIAPKIHLM